MKLYLGAVQLSKVAKGTFPLLPAVLVKKATTPPPQVTVSSLAVMVLLTHQSSVSYLDDRSLVWFSSQR